MVARAHRLITLSALTSAVLLAGGLVSTSPALALAEVVLVRQAAPADDGGGALAPRPIDPHAISWHIAGTQGRGARLRSGPSSAAPTIGVLPEGTLVELESAPTRGDGTGWQKVRLISGLEGWVSEVLVHAPTGSTITPSDKTPQPVGTALVVGNTGGSGARLHTGTSISTQTIATISDGSAAEQLEGPVYVEGRFWRKIKVVDQVGWMVDDFIYTYR